MNEYLLSVPLELCKAAVKENEKVKQAAELLNEGAEIPEDLIYSVDAVILAGMTLCALTTSRKYMQLKDDVKQAIETAGGAEKRSLQEMLADMEKLETKAAAMQKKLELDMSKAKHGADTVEAIEADEATAEAIYTLIRQGVATNSLAKLNTRSGIKIDSVTGTATATYKGVTLSITDYNKLTDFTTSTCQLLDAFMQTFTATGAKSPRVSMRLDDYMILRGLTDRRGAREQVAEDLDILFNAKISYRERGGGFYDMRIISGKGAIKSGIITINFGDEFYRVLKGYVVMPYPKQLWRINSHKNPNSYYFLRQLAEHKNMNAGKRNENIIAVKTLLKAAPLMPTKKEVAETDRAFTRRIIKPFERDMNALSETLTWQYCKKGGEPLTDAEAASLDYDSFVLLNVKTTWHDYPSADEWLKRKAERIEAAVKKKAEREARAAKRAAKGEQKPLNDTPKNTPQSGEQ